MSNKAYHQSQPAEKQNMNELLFIKQGEGQPHITLGQTNREPQIGLSQAHQQWADYE